MNINTSSSSSPSPSAPPPAMNTTEKKSNKLEEKAEKPSNKIARISAANISPHSTTPAALLSDHTFNESSGEKEMESRINIAREQQPLLSLAPYPAWDPSRTREVVINGREFIPLFAGSLAEKKGLSQKLGVLIQSIDNWNNSDRLDKAKLPKLIEMHAKARLLLFFHLCVAYGNSHCRLEWKPAKFQLYQGSSPDEACHHSIFAEIEDNYLERLKNTFIEAIRDLIKEKKEIPSALMDKLQALGIPKEKVEEILEIIQEKGGSLRIPVNEIWNSAFPQTYYLSLFNKQRAFYYLNNHTLIAPSELNKVDDFIEVNGRPVAIKLLREVANGKMAPREATQELGRYLTRLLEEHALAENEERETLELLRRNLFQWREFTSKLSKLGSSMNPSPVIKQIEFIHEAYSWINALHEQSQYLSARYKGNQALDNLSQALQRINTYNDKLLMNSYASIQHYNKLIETKVAAIKEKKEELGKLKQEAIQLDKEYKKKRKAIGEPQELRVEIEKLKKQAEEFKSALELSEQSPLEAGIGVKEKELMEEELQQLTAELLSKQNTLNEYERAKKKAEQGRISSIAAKKEIPETLERYEEMLKNLKQDMQQVIEEILLDEERDRRIPQILNSLHLFLASNRLDIPVMINELKQALPRYQAYVELQFKATQQLTEHIGNTSEEETNLQDLQMFLISRLKPLSPSP
ncbi:hypothetical protein DB41_KH00020 [Neochlamydia sp. TUME1]|uniref:hypothetical protein n=1 Tax=Neochlamydia sp. TUME1 TaxID=1478174 RepID=UPI00057D02D5|nr:hypothetical protein [Neochlamydia sp. TUME1]KIC72618.1 hypothetical protein DB41_KH00020 [Neochlamydia sp. TUME1]